MKGLLRGMVAVGLLTGVGLGTGCTDQRPETGAFKTPIQDKYQSPTAEAREPLQDQRFRHPDQERWHGGYDDHPRRAGGTTAPSIVVGEENMGTGGAGSGQPLGELGLGLADSYQAMPPRDRTNQRGQAPQQAGEVDAEAPTTEGR